MKQFKLSYLFLIAVAVLFGGCKLERLPETQFSDANYWNTEADLMNAANRMYQQLAANWIDNRGDDNVSQGGENKYR